MREMHKTSFKQLVIGEKFRLPGSDVLMVKEILRQEPELEWVNATYDLTHQGRPCYIYGDVQVVRRRSNQGTELRRSRLNTGCGKVR